jgi:hypothetical protein
MPLSSRPRQLVEGSISSGGSGCGSATTAPAPDAFSRGPFGSVGVGPAVASCWPPPCIAPADVSAAVRSSCSPIAVPQSSSTWWRAVCAAARHASGGGAGSSPSGARPANYRWPRQGRPAFSAVGVGYPGIGPVMPAVARSTLLPTPPGQRWHPQRSVSASSFKVLPAALLMCCGADPDTAVDCSRRTLDASSVVSSLADSLRPWTAGTRLSEIGCGAWKR